VLFFAGLTIGRVADPDDSLERVALVASPHDLLATKLQVLPQRAERKNDQDVANLLASGLALSAGRWAGGGAGAVGHLEKLRFQGHPTIETHVLNRADLTPNPRKRPFFEVPCSWMDQAFRSLRA